MQFHVLILTSCLWTLLAADVCACINVYGTDRSGKTIVSIQHSESRIEGLRLSVIDKNYWREQEATLAEGLETSNFKHRSDYAAALIYLGRADEAIVILEDVERENPGEYIVASNLGTAYELSGDLEKALHWIRKGYELNPVAHSGTEWLHVKILETKLNLATDPEWLKTHSVLGLDFGNDSAPTLPGENIIDVTGSTLTIEEIVRGVDYQLHERLKFVAPQDPIVGDLLFDLANLVALTEAVENAVPINEFSEKYGVREPALLSRRLDHLQSLIATNVRSGMRQGDGDLVLVLLIVAAAAIFVFVSLVIFIVVKRRKSRREISQP